MAQYKGGSDYALALLRTLPRVTRMNIPAEPSKNHGMKRKHGQHVGIRHGGPQKGGYQRMRYPKLGYAGDGELPWFAKVPVENYYKGHHLRRQYPPISLRELQLCIDLNRVDVNDQIDLVALCNTKLWDFNPSERHYGFQISEDGIDIFKAKINIECQWTTEPVIAAIEKNGGTITTAYYDLHSLFAARNPVKFFTSGKPIPKRMIPPEDAMEYYTDPKFRGYLADPDKVAEERLVLAQKYGFEVNKIENDPKKDLLLKRKDPRQIFFGLQPGWVVSMRDKCILKPKDETLLEYYNN